MQRFNDSVVQSRIDRRYLATVCKWFVTNGKLPRTISELVREAVISYVDVLVVNGKIEPFNSTDEAREYLGSLFGDTVMNPKGLGRMNVHKNLILDDVERNPRLLNNSSGDYKKVQESMRIEEIRRGMRGIPVNIEDAKKYNLARVTYDENGVCNNKFREIKIEKPTDWDKEKVPTINKKERDRLLKEAIEKIDSQYKVVEFKEEGPIDRNDCYTVKPMTAEDIKEWEMKEAIKLKEQQDAMDSYDPRTDAIKEAEL